MRSSQHLPNPLKSRTNDTLILAVDRTGMLQTARWSETNGMLGRSGTNWENLPDASASFAPTNHPVFP